MADPDGVWSGLWKMLGPKGESLISFVFIYLFIFFPRRKSGVLAPNVRVRPMPCSFMEVCVCVFVHEEGRQVFFAFSLERVRVCHALIDGCQ